MSPRNEMTHRRRGGGCASLAFAVALSAPACRPAPPAVVEIVAAVPGAWLPESLELELAPSGKPVQWKRGDQMVLEDVGPGATLAPRGDSWLGLPAAVTPDKRVTLRVLPLSPLDAELRPRAWPPGTSPVILFVDLSLAAEIELSWRDGLLLTDRARCARSPEALEAAAVHQWKHRGRHTSFRDPHRDVAVLLVGAEVRLSDVEPFARAISRVQRSVGDAWGPAFDTRVARASLAVRPGPTRGPTREELERVPEPVAALATGDLRVSGRIEKNVVIDALQKRARVVAACAARWPGEKPELELKLVYGADGVVGQATVRQGGVESELAICVADGMRQAPFPEPQGGTVTLSGALRFEQGQRPRVAPR